MTDDAEIIEVGEPAEDTVTDRFVERMTELVEELKENEPETVSELQEAPPIESSPLPVGLVLRPFAYLLRHTPIRPKTGVIDAADAQDAKERIRQRHGFRDLNFEVEITPQE